MGYKDALQDKLIDVLRAEIGRLVRRVRKW